jgi:hypothetical protein
MEATERLAALINGKHRVLLELRELGLRQAEFVRAGETGSLLKLLAVKQQLITTLQDLERQLTPHYKEDPDGRAWSSPAQRAECARQAATCNKVLQEILSIEKVCAEKMSARRNEVAEQLQQVHAAAHVRSAYESQRRTRV